MLKHFYILLSPYISDFYFITHSSYITFFYNFILTFPFPYLNLFLLYFFSSLTVSHFFPISTLTSKLNTPLQSPPIKPRCDIQTNRRKSFNTEENEKVT